MKNKLKYYLLTLSTLSFLLTTGCEKEIPVVDLSNCSIINTNKPEANSVYYFSDFKVPEYDSRDRAIAYEKYDESILNYYILNQEYIYNAYDIISEFNGTSVHNQTGGRYYYDEMNDWVVSFDQYGTFIYGRDIILFRANKVDYGNHVKIKDNHIIIAPDAYVVVKDQMATEKLYYDMLSNMIKSDKEVTVYNMSNHGYQHHHDKIMELSYTEKHN